MPTHAAPQPGWSTALALPCSAFPLLQHLLLHSLPRTSTAGWPDQALPARQLWCVGHGADELQLVLPESSSTPLLPGRAQRVSSDPDPHMWGLLQQQPGELRERAGAFLPPVREWMDGNIYLLEHGAPLSQGPVPVQPQLQKVSKYVFTERAYPHVSVPQRRRSEACSPPQRTAPRSGLAPAASPAPARADPPPAPAAPAPHTTRPLPGAPEAGPAPREGGKASWNSCLCDLGQCLVLAAGRLLAGGGLRVWGCLGMHKAWGERAMQSWAEILKNGISLPSHDLEWSGTASPSSIFNSLLVLSYLQVFLTFPQLFLQILQKKSWE